MNKKEEIRIRPRNSFRYGKSMVFLLVMLFSACTILPASCVHTTGGFLEKKELLPEQQIFVDSASLGGSEKIYEIINAINTSDLQFYLEKLTTVYKGRVTGSALCYEAGDWIYDTFKNMSTLVVKKHVWSSRGNVYHFFRKYDGENIIAELPGKSETKKIIVFSAHYDVLKSNSSGALDNGAGVAALLTIAKTLSEYEYEHTIRFIAFSGEEQGNLGSYRYVQECYQANDQILVVLNADVIGNNTYNSNGMFNVVKAFSTYPAKWVVTIMDHVCKEYNISISVHYHHYFGHSDDKAFDDYGYPAMQLFQSGGGMEPFYGTEEDTINLINISYLLNVTKCFAAGLAFFSDTPQYYPIVQITSPNSGQFYGGKFNLLRLSKGRTIVLGPFVVTTFIDDSHGGEIRNVSFELIKGLNEIGIPDEDRLRIARFNDTTPPYEWSIKERCFGWYTIRAEIYDEEGCSFSDEIEVFIIKGSLTKEFLNTIPLNKEIR
jgi:hypothetical protein